MVPSLRAAQIPSVMPLGRSRIPRAIFLGKPDQASFGLVRDLRAIEALCRICWERSDPPLTATAKRIRGLNQQPDERRIDVRLHDGGLLRD